MGVILKMGYFIRSRRKRLKSHIHKSLSKIVIHIPLDSSYHCDCPHSIKIVFYTEPVKNGNFDERWPGQQFLSRPLL